MERLNYAFLEKFKRLEKICNDIYHQPSGGLTRYIEDMKAVPAYNSRNIPNWSFDLQQLIRLRRIRNNLAHVEGAFSQKLCVQDDIGLLENFHARIMNQTDPLALLYQKCTTKEQPSKPVSIDLPTSPRFSTITPGWPDEDPLPGQWEDVPKRSGIPSWALVIAVAVVFAFIFFFSK